MIKKRKEKGKENHPADQVCTGDKTTIRSIRRYSTGFTNNLNYPQESSRSSKILLLRANLGIWESVLRFGRYGYFGLCCAEGADRTKECIKSRLKLVVSFHPHSHTFGIHSKHLRLSFYIIILLVLVWYLLLFVDR